MSNVAFFIDLPNFYSRLLKSGIEKPRFLRDYFLEWLDFDLLALSLTETYRGIWIFYSGERIGPSSERIEGKIFREYIDRINALQGVTARNVNIPGEQREPISYKCENCSHEGKSEFVSEKGIDSSLTVHLFDTMDSWDTAYLLSGDADFVPVVASLRRRGKIVIGVGFEDASAALVRECYHYINLEEAFLKRDLLAYSLFNKDGVIHKWLSNEIKQDPSLTPTPTIELKVSWGPEGRWGGSTYTFGSFVPYSPPSYWFAFNFNGSIELSDRNQIMIKLQEKYKSQVDIEMAKNNKVQNCRVLGLPNFVYEAIRRRYRTNLLPIHGLVISDLNKDSCECSIIHKLNEKTGKYELVTYKDTP